jgi:hypothetical protein
MTRDSLSVFPSVSVQTIRKLTVILAGSLRFSKISSPKTEI